MRHKHNSQSGFTLIELLISVTIALIIVTMVATVYVSLDSDRNQYRATAEVENAGYEAMSLITQTVRNATSISTPVAGATSTSLSLVVPTSSLSPTVFSLGTSTASSSLTMSQASTSISITGTEVSVSGIIFSNLTNTSTSGIVRIQFTVTQNSYSRVFYGSAAIRKFKQ